MKRKFALILAALLLAASFLSLSACTFRKSTAATSAASTSDDWMDGMTPSTDDSDENWTPNY